MSQRHFLLLLAALAFTVPSVHAQPGGRGFGGPGAPRGFALGGVMSRFFGENTAYSATMNLGSKSDEGGEMTMAGKVAYDEGQSRFEMDLTKITGGRMPASAGEQMKAMGMAEMVIITRPDKKLTYMIYPGLQSYAENPLREETDTEAAKKFKVEITKLGEETMAGQACVKNKVVVTDAENKAHTAITWNATALKDFPIVIETNEKGAAITLLFTDVKLGKPAATTFEPPKDFKKYDSMQQMMREVMMKRFNPDALDK